MADLSRRASLSGASFPPVSMPPAPHDFGHFNFGQSDRRGDNNGPAPRPKSSTQQQQQSQQQQQQASTANSNTNRPHSPGQFQHNAPPVYDHPPTVGGPSGSSTSNNSTSSAVSNPGPGATVGAASGGGSNRPGFANQRRESNVPGWAVPPRVLLVEDDSVCRKLSSKFLEVFGCDIDVAVDGVSAVNKMKMQKYDLVLMVRP